MRGRTVREVARFELKGLVKDRRFWSISVVSVLIWYVFESRSYTEAEAELLGQSLGLVSLQITFATVTLIAGILVGVRAVSGKREAGNIKYLLSLPSTRSELLVGIVAGRATAVFVAELVVCVVAFPYVYATYGTLPVGSTGLLFLGLGLYTVATVSIGTLASTVVQKSSGATVVGVLLLLCSLLWTNLSKQFYTMITGTPVSYVRPPADPLLFGLVRLFPRDAFFVMTNGFFGGPNVAASPRLAFPRENPVALVVEQVPEMATPIYLEQWFGVVILLGWIAITLGPAAVLFERGDLT